MVKVIVPGVWSAERRTEYNTGEGKLHDLIRRFVDEYPVFRRRLLDRDGAPLQYINFCVDDDLIPRHMRDTTEVPAGSTVTVIAPMAGG